jgi:cyclopropane-fatty-acyl-phospholipid synthase
MTNSTATTIGARVRRKPGDMLVRWLFAHLRCGILTVILPDGRRLAHRCPAPGPDAMLKLKRWRVFRRLVLGGDIGFAEAYMDGDWTSPDLSSLIELAALNQSSMPAAEGGAVLSRLAHRLRHLARRNTLSGSRRNIAQHYDLGNDFYARWLDDGMSYSSGLFRTSADSLEVAQAAKQEKIISMLSLRPGQKVLELGFGWGGLAERLARAGCHVTGLTLSPAQHAYAQARLHDAGLADRVDLRLQDYREVGGTYDRIVSIEMLEAVGERWWPVYFDILRRRLRPGGVVVLQTITIADERFEAYRRGVDFIQHYIFPGGMLPSPAVLRTQIAQAGLALHKVETFGASYALTLGHWLRSFEAAWPAIEQMGFPSRFRRMWEYYLSYCEAGFRTGAVDVGLWRLEHRC